MQESNEDKDMEKEKEAVDGDEEAVRVEETEAQEAAVPGLASDMGVEETAPRRPEEDEEEAKKTAPERQEEEEREAAPAPVE